MILINVWSLPAPTFPVPTPEPSIPPLNSQTSSHSNPIFILSPRPSQTLNNTYHPIPPTHTISSIPRTPLPILPVPPFVLLPTRQPLLHLSDCTLPHPPTPLAFPFLSSNSSGTNTIFLLHALFLRDNSLVTIHTKDCTSCTAPANSCRTGNVGDVGLAALGTGLDKAFAGAGGIQRRGCLRRRRWKR